MRNEISRRDPHFCLITYAGSIDILRCFFSRKNPLAWLLIFSEKPMSPELNFDIPINHYIIFSTLKFLANEKFVSRGNHTVSWLRKSSFFFSSEFLYGSLPIFAERKRELYLSRWKGMIDFFERKDNISWKLSEFKIRRKTKIHSKSRSPFKDGKAKRKGILERV